MGYLAKSLAAAAALTFATAAQAAVVFAPSGTVAAGTLTLDHDAGNPVNLGNVFTANSNGYVTSLGFYTPTNLVGGGETVGLYDSAGALLTSTFVSVPTNTAGSYAFQAITPVLLTAGQQYTVVNFVGQNAWAYGTVATSGGITFNYNSYTYGPALAFTTSVGGSGPAYIGPNLVFEAVPEPATWGMMILGFGMIGYGMRRRRAAVRTTVRFA